MTIDELGDLIGTKAIINSSISKKKYRAKFIGYNKGQGLIISQPAALWGSMDLLVGEELVIRFLANEKACAFKAWVVHMASIPYQHIHLSYPVQFQFENYRNYIRLRTKELSALLLIPGQEPQSTTVTNISLGGLQVFCRTPELTEGMELKVKFVLPQQSNIAPIVLPVAIRNCNKLADGFDCYGLEYVSLKPDNVSRLQQLVGYCISSQDSEPVLIN